MLAEERQLRDRIREYAPTLYEEKRMLSFLTAIKKAVREDAAKVAYEEALMHKSGNAKWDVNVGENIAAAIRRK